MPETRGKTLEDIDEEFMNEGVRERSVVVELGMGSSETGVGGGIRREGVLIDNASRSEDGRGNASEGKKKKGGIMVVQDVHGEGDREVL